MFIDGGTIIGGACTMIRAVSIIIIGGSTGVVTICLGCIIVCGVDNITVWGFRITNSWGCGCATSGSIIIIWGGGATNIVLPGINAGMPAIPIRGGFPAVSDGCMASRSKPLPTCCCLRGAQVASGRTI